jgi:hypothetical protein
MVKAIPGSRAKCRQLLGVRDPDHFLPSLPRFGTISTERLILWQYQSSGPISSIYPRIKRDSWGASDFVIVFDSATTFRHYQRTMTDADPERAHVCAG